MKKITAITVCVNYDDLLQITLQQNHIFFDKWYIITSKEDTSTLEVIQKYNYSNIVVLFYDFKTGGKVFNKGGAIRMCQDMLLSKLDENETILLLDAYIYLPNEFPTVMDATEIQKDVLYGGYRVDYYSLNALLSSKYDCNYGYTFQGCFQLYKNSSKYLYNDSEDCSQCDNIFQDLFTKKENVKDLFIFHLGISTVNWKGRVNHGEFYLNK